MEADQDESSSLQLVPLWSNVNDSLILPDTIASQTEDTCFSWHFQVKVNNESGIPASCTYAQRSA